MKLFSAAAREELKTEWRHREITRIEGFSDAVFGFAVTLLIVSLEVPRTSGELLETMKGFAGFLATFAILFSLWYRQFLFFRRYGLEDTKTIVLNGALLVVVLFFVYPLKFISGALINRALGSKTVTLASGRIVPAIEPGHLPTLLAVYGFGLSAVFTVFALLLRHAYSKRNDLQLSPLEVYDTTETLRLYTWLAAIGAIVAATNALTAMLALSENSTWMFAVAGVQLVAVARLLRIRAGRRSRRNNFLAGLSATQPDAG